ncbi:hypothetical protein HID58_014976, partial [Brassica napus]
HWKECHLKEIPSFGNRLSWAEVRDISSNDIKEKVWIQCRLDKAFENAEWFRLFPSSHSRYLYRLGSDHRPLVTSLTHFGQRRTWGFIRSGVQTFLLVKKRHKKESSLVDRRGSNVNADSNIKRLQQIWRQLLTRKKLFGNRSVRTLGYMLMKKT